MRLRVTRRAATQIEKALDYIEAESPEGANNVGKGPEGPTNPLLPLLRRQKSPLPGRLFRDQRDLGMCLGALSGMQAVVQ